MICLSGSCPLYTVEANDTCVGIYQANNVTWSQLLAWNPYVLLTSAVGTTMSDLFPDS